MKGVIGWIAIILTMCTVSCVLNHPVQTSGQASLQGDWEEVLGGEKLDSANLFRSIYQFKFHCDSVYIQTSFWAANSYEDPHCFTHGHWTEFQKGGYRVRGDSLIVEGVYTNSSFKIKIAGCHPSGNFREVFVLKNEVSVSNQKSPPFSGPTYLILSNPNENIPIRLKRVRSWVCLPSPLT